MPSPPMVEPITLTGEIKLKLSPLGDENVNSNLVIGKNRKSERTIPNRVMVASNDD